MAAGPPGRAVTRAVGHSLVLDLGGSGRNDDRVPDSDDGSVHNRGSAMGIDGHLFQVGPTSDADPECCGGCCPFNLARGGIAVSPTAVPPGQARMRSPPSRSTATPAADSIGRGRLDAATAQSRPKCARVRCDELTPVHRCSRPWSPDMPSRSRPREVVLPRATGARRDTSKRPGPSDPGAFSVSSGHACRRSTLSAGRGRPRSAQTP